MKRETKYPYIMVDSEGVVQNIAMFDDYAPQIHLLKHATEMGLVPMHIGMRLV